MDSSDQSHGNEIESCAESCHSDLMKEYNLKSRSQSHYSDDKILLASSAVDAMFSYRNSGDEEGHIDTDSDSRVDSKKTNDNEEQNRVQDVSHGYMANRPRRLPPLIQSLVGVRGSDFDEGKAKTNRPTITPTKRSQYLYSENVKDAAGSQSRHNDNSVAKVAAAAAAAVLSEAEGRIGRSTNRMKVYNDEWDGALRWISTWGQNHHNSHHDNSIEMSSHGMDRERRVSLDGDVRARRHRRKEQVYDYDYAKSQTGTSSDSTRITDFDKLLDKCTKKCRGRQAGKDKARGTQIKSSSTGMGRLYSKIELSQNFMWKLFSRQVSHNIIGIVLSTALMWLLRNANDWWKLNRYTTTLQQLLREESEADASSATVKKYKPRTGGNKKQKKKGRKQEHRSLKQCRNNFRSSNCNERDMGEWEREEEHSDSDDSFNEVYLNNVGNRRHANTMDSYSDQASKGTISTASYTTIDSQSIGFSRMFKQESTPDSKGVPCQKRSLPKLSSLDSPQNRRFYPVPTESQREAAHRNLKAYQQMKLKKLIEQNERVKKVGQTRVTKKLTMKEVVLKNLPKEPNHSSSQKPPGLCLEEKSYVNTSQDQSVDSNLPHVDEQNDVDLMVSSILDDDDINVPTHRSDGHKKIINDENKSVALGDLLAPGTFCHTPLSNWNVTNPWNDNSHGIGGACNSLQSVLSQNEDITTDANTKLQVSAAEFLPSWGKAKSDSSPKIW